MEFFLIMSEYQNKAVELMQLRSGEDSILDIKDRRNDFLRRAIELFYAMEGDAAEISAAAQKVYSTGHQLRVDRAVGDVMYKLAGVAHLYDIDMMQAAYNKLEEAHRQIASIRLTRKI